MKPDDRIPDMWERPATRTEQVDSLAERLQQYNEERAREQLRERVRLIGWVFAIGFVVLFLLVAERLT